MRRILLMGFSKGMLGHLEGWAEPGSVTVLEEPDLLQKKRFDVARRDYRSIGEVVPARYHQSEEFIAPILDRHRSEPFDCVVPCLEYSVLAAAVVAERTGLPGATPGAAGTLRDKLRLRAVTTAAGMPAPEHRAVRSAAEVAAFVAGGPCVLKPASRQASLGVQFLDPAASDSTVAAAWQATISAVEPRQLPDRPLRWTYLVERRLLGTEYSVEALVRGGALIFCNVTLKAVLSGSCPVELGHVVPAPLDGPGVDEFRRAMTDLVAATGYDSGILHAEWMATDGGLVLIECAGRIPGDRIIELIDLAYGMRLCHALVDLLSARPLVVPQRPVRAASIRFLTAVPGTVESISGHSAVTARSEVEEAMVTVQPGDEVRPLRSSWDRIGHVMVTAPTSHEAVGLAVQAADGIDVRTHRAHASAPVH